MKLDWQIISRQPMMPPGLQDALHLGQHGLGIRDVHEDVVAVGHVKVAVLKGQGGNVADVEHGVVLSLLRRDCSRQLNLGLLHVNAVENAGGGGLGQAHGDGAGPAAEVEDALAPA